MVMAVEPTILSSRHVVFAGGGTGGHLFPAIAVAEALTESYPDLRITFFGTHRPIDARILGETNYELVQQTLPALSLRPWRWPGMLLGYSSATRACRARFTTDRPGVVVGTGGLGSVPALREAHRLGIPTALINPDVIPGKANRHLAPMADVVFVQWPEAGKHLPAGVELITTGCPTRAAFGSVSRIEALKRFGLDASRRTLLVTGASQGARTVNQAVLTNLDFLAEQRDWQVLHLSGDADYDQVRQAYEQRSVGATVLPFTPHMAAALDCADLVITRGGASTLAEITAVGVASIIFPYPFHRDRHQEANGRCLVRDGAAAMVIDRIDPNTNGPALRELLERLMGDDQKRQAMADAARSVGRPDAARDVSRRLVEMIGSGATLRKCETMEAIC